ncbi:dihydrodipicolinate synthase family protein [Haloferula rosea]|uniref:Dihydrodipicolinate synthase family protein n=1 Tax=Haloferula rosea TaxID=490093 RepID=A0A934R9T1_9BACT|nr:dihydrodipicolinate synthase family protein [Haloferula rosea]MBK1826555.1 dihydrodipicolinate synthase family protein [Haloferula rosea]
MITPLHGLVAATHTPFHSDGSLAPEVVPLQAAHLSKQGVNAAFITGSTGEAHSLTRDERVTLYQAWASAAPDHGIRVIAHAGSNCLEDARHFAAVAQDLNLFAVSALAPSYYKPPTLTALVDWCESIASSAPNLPFYYYDIPVLTGVEFPMDAFLKEASPRIPNLAGIKFTNPDLNAFEKSLGADDGRFDVPWGIDENLIDALKLGAKGGVGSSYNFAAPLYQELIDAFHQGDLETAQELQRRSVEMIEAIASIGYLGAAKAIMGTLGVPVGPARQPIPNPTASQIEALLPKLHEMGVLGELSCR